MPAGFDFGMIEELRVFRARGGEDVGRRALLDLRRQLVGAGEVVARPAVDRREHLGERRGREDVQVAGGVMTRPRDPRQDRGDDERTEEDAGSHLLDASRGLMATSTFS
jgi:hypothetical protein